MNKAKNPGFCESSWRKVPTPVWNAECKAETSQDTTASAHIYMMGFGRQPGAFNIKKRAVVQTITRGDELNFIIQDNLRWMPCCMHYKYSATLGSGKPKDSAEAHFGKIEVGTDQFASVLPYHCWCHYSIWRACWRFYWQWCQRMDICAYMAIQQISIGQTMKKMLSFHRLKSRGFFPATKNNFPHA